MTGTSPVIFRQAGNILLLPGQQEKGKTGPQAQLHHRQVKFEIICSDPAGRLGASLVCVFSEMAFWGWFFFVC